MRGIRDELAYVLFSHETRGPDWLKKAAWARPLESVAKVEYRKMADAILASNAIRKIQAEAIREATEGVPTRGKVCDEHLDSYGTL